MIYAFLYILTFIIIIFGIASPFLLYKSYKEKKYSFEFFLNLIFTLIFTPIFIDAFIFTEIDLLFSFIDYFFNI